ncbi:GGDEF domain-containing protein [Poseidonibacter lekithochrous]|uniref:GGDEF domain-containing protein n=1 Tax=Poseidonibacter lekithochrous TaxID=1904463 RepID=UPI000D3AD248|nr:GGDEF domain-containing protein [Poseidonibacter lekithochrous]
MNKAFDFNPYEALKSILEATSLHIGKDFIKSAADEIKKLYKADLVFITKAVNFNPTTKVEVLYATNKNIPKEFELVGTPCELVFQNKIVEIHENVKNDFYKAKDSGFESFYGVPINNDGNECIGHISIFSKEKRKLAKELEDIALIYSRKIEREIFRLELEIENDKIREELEKLTITDPLTNTYNRRHFINSCSDLFQQVKRCSIKATLAYIDIDDFKNINDKFGHDGGDKVLTEFSNILKDQTRNGIDKIYRIGGEEFCILSINATLDSTYLHLNRLMNTSNTYFENSQYGKITLSVGLVEFTKELENFNDLVNIADKKMYQAKKNGKNTIVK